MTMAKSLSAASASRADSSDAVIQVSGLHKVYGNSVTALENIDLSFMRGQLTSLLGPSGCGKTTLLKIIAGLLEPTSGEVLVNGKPVRGPGPERAFVFQDFALMPWATVLRNAAFGLECPRHPQGRARRSCAALHQGGRPRRVRGQVSA